MKKAEFKYRKNSQIEQEIFNNKPIKVYSYYQNGLPLDITYKDFNGNIVDNRVYTYDDFQNVITKKSKIEGQSTGYKQSTVYKYDEMNRLTEGVSEYTDKTEKSNYEYDFNSNLIFSFVDTFNKNTKQRDSVSEYYNCDINGQINGATVKTIKLVPNNGAYNVNINTENHDFKYDLQGNLTRETRGNSIDREYIYDDLNRMINFKDNKNSANNAEYFYTGDGLRSRKKVNGVTTQFYYNANNKIIGESNSNSEAISYLVTNRVLSSISSKNGGFTGLNYLISDAHGDIIALQDETGAKVADYEYLPFGNESIKTGSIKSNFRYSGEYLDSESGLYYLKARYYSPAIKRFTQFDTYRGEVINPLTLNSYAYCQGNPIMYTDPTGHNPAALVVMYGLRLAQSPDTCSDIAEVVYDASQGDVGGVVGGVVATALPGASAQMVKGSMMGIKRSLKEWAEIGQEAHRQLQVQGEKSGKWPFSEVVILLKNGQKVRKDGADDYKSPTKVRIIKPNTISGQNSAKRRAKLMEKEGFDVEIEYYNPYDPKFLPGSETYIGPNSMNGGSGSSHPSGSAKKVTDYEKSK